MQKAALRKAVRSDFPELSGDENDFIFDLKWQSTDCSDSTASSAREDADKNAAAEDEADGQNRHKTYKKRKKSNVWTTRAPNFRSQQVSLCDHVDIRD